MTNIIIITESWSQRLFCTLAFDSKSSAVHVNSIRLVVSTWKWNASSEVYVEDDFTSFWKWRDDSTWATRLEYFAKG